MLLNNPASHLSTPSLQAPFTTFRRQLLSLLGVPALPSGVTLDTTDPFSDWQLDALVRHRARENMENAKETLKSIVQLVNQIDNMPVGQDVRGDVQGALTALDNVRLPSTSVMYSGTHYTLARIGSSNSQLVLYLVAAVLKRGALTRIARVLQPGHVGPPLLPRRAQVCRVRASVRVRGRPAHRCGRARICGMA